MRPALGIWVHRHRRPEPSAEVFSVVDGSQHTSGNGRSGGGRHVRAEDINQPRRRRFLTIGLPVLVVAGLVTLFLTIPGKSKPVPLSAAAGSSSASIVPTGNSLNTGGSASATGSTPPTSAGSPGTEQGSASPRSCPLTGALTVAAAPEIADLVREAIAGPVAEISPDRSCEVTVVAGQPADFAADWQQDASARPDVWIPDSSMWVALAGRAGVPVPSGSPSVATSPLVLALAASTAQHLDPSAGPIHLNQILASRKTDSPIRLGLPDPTRSAASVGAVLEVQSSVAGQPDGRAALTWAMLSSPAGLPIQGSELLARLSTDPNTALPVSEQTVWAHNNTAGAAPAVAVYGASGGTRLDYPYVVMATDPARAAVAATTLAQLRSESASRLFQHAGFRDGGGLAGPVLTTASGVDPAVTPDSATPSLSAVDAVVHAFSVSVEPSRLLAVLDVSGSMAGLVPGGDGATRLDFARAAAIRGLGLYPPDSEIGFWIFSRSLTATTDYQQIVPVGELAAVTDGVSGEQRIAQALTATQVNPDGGTGLYDTTLAAVRAMRANWDPTRVNAVLILSDGQNDDLGSISLDNLLGTLRSEQDPAHPVPVIAIAFGPDSDVSAMTRISSATGGATYVAKDPRDIGEIFLDAVGQRVCRPTC